MDWRTRIAAIVLAGGSVTGCASAADPGDAGTPEAGPRPSAEPSQVGVGPMPTILVNLAPEPPPPAAPTTEPRVRIPLCNANPDPCCHFPDAPECHRPE